MSPLPRILDPRIALRSTLIASLCALAACGGEAPIAEAEQALYVECVDAGEAMPEGSWACGEDRVVECGSPRGTFVDAIHASVEHLDVQATCDGLDLEVNDPGPFPVGETVIEVGEAGNPAMCVSRLTVVDTTPPRAGGAYLELWPPNHKMYWLTAEECAAGAADTCDPDVSIELQWATSDEPLDDTGDGDTEEDITDLGCDGVALRAERAGTGDGRVYRVAYTVTDDTGNATEGACVVVVRHDQGDMGPVQANVEAYRVPLQGCL